MPYFSPEEYRCKCGICPVEPLEASLLQSLEDLRGRYGRPMYLSSGRRCEAQNARVGGVPGSAHVTGHAVDVFCTSSRDRYDILSLALPRFKRVGIGGTFIHLDNDTTKDQGVIWLYGAH